jgi:SpoVK/Ycf46/Vps4 family AAA+-type ATPase
LEIFVLKISLFYSFEKRIYIPLPGVNERAAMFKAHLGTSTYHTIQEKEWMQLAQRAEQ